ncbi:MAG TPA: hypothetical protein DCZ11_03775, partial [Gammaproteobacteria bacterium]|nr:hypothetical protein [Gammaproteobacteria bacterium]MCH77547.1 hypothetical protein [Gammaproteobacteria bacterium]
MRLAYQASERILEIVARHPAAKGRAWAGAKAIGIIDGRDRLAAAAVFHDWRPEAAVIDFSCVSWAPRWLTRGVLHAIMAYPFEQLECQAVHSVTDPANTHIRRMAQAVGATEHVVPRLLGPRRGEVHLVLTAE